MEIAPFSEQMPEWKFHDLNISKSISCLSMENK